MDSHNCGARRPGFPGLVAGCPGPAGFVVSRPGFTEFIASRLGFAGLVASRPGFTGFAVGRAAHATCATITVLLTLLIVIAAIFPWQPTASSLSPGPLSLGIALAADTTVTAAGSATPAAAVTAATAEDAAAAGTAATSGDAAITPQPSPPTWLDRIPPGLGLILIFAVILGVPSVLSWGIARFMQQLQRRYVHRYDFAVVGQWLLGSYAVLILAIVTLLVMLPTFSGLGRSPGGSGSPSTALSPGGSGGPDGPGEPGVPAPGPSSAAAGRIGGAVGLIGAVAEALDRRLPYRTFSQVTIPLALFFTAALAGWFWWHIRQGPPPPAENRRRSWAIERPLGAGAGARPPHWPRPRRRPKRE